nr:MAG TPA: hypothetical protein [Caudoviricetes sp.]
MRKVARPRNVTRHRKSKITKCTPVYILSCQTTKPTPLYVILRFVILHKSLLYNMT